MDISSDHQIYIQIPSVHETLGSLSLQPNGQKYVSISLAIPGLRWFSCSLTCLRSPQFSWVGWVPLLSEYTPWTESILFLFCFPQHARESAGGRHSRKIIETESLEIRLSLKMILQSKSVRNSSSRAWFVFCYRICFWNILSLLDIVKTRVPRRSKTQFQGPKRQHSTKRAGKRKSSAEGVQTRAGVESKAESGMRYIYKMEEDEGVSREWNWKQQASTGREQK